jgi:serine protease Do
VLNHAFMRLLSFLLLIGCGGVNASAPQPVSSPPSFNPAASLAPLAQAVEPAVVNVYVTSAVQNRFFGASQGQGSGFVISPDGYILTNNHVAENAAEIKVKFTNGEEYKAAVVGADPASDVALLKIQASKELSWLKLGDSDALLVGDWVLAVGNPLGLGQTVTAGIISGKGRELSDQLHEEFLQTDASINPGNSGGPLIALNGMAVGMNTAIISGANSIGFAIPSSYLKNIVEQLKETGHVSRGYLGVSMSELSEAGIRLVGREGALLVGVVEGGPAAAAGLQAGDVVIRVGGQEILSQRDLLQAISNQKPGTRVRVEVMRQGKVQAFEVILAERPG